MRSSSVAASPIQRAECGPGPTVQRIDLDAAVVGERREIGGEETAVALASADSV